MGACFNTKRIRTTKETEVIKAWHTLIENLLYEYGHDSYNGTFSTCSGLTIKNRTFSSVEKAEEYISNNTEKWGDAIAVTIKEDDKEPYTLIGGWCAE